MRYLPWGKDRFTSRQTLTSYKFTGQREEAGIGSQGLKPLADTQSWLKPNWVEARQLALANFGCQVGNSLLTGQREEAGLGLYYYGARWYDPALGRFIRVPLGRDTIRPNPGDAQSFDRYAYVNNNLLRYSDPTGHYSRDKILQHFGCAENDWACVEAQFSPTSRSISCGTGDEMQMLLGASNRYAGGNTIPFWAKQPETPPTSRHQAWG